MSYPNLFPEIKNFVKKIEQETKEIPEHRRQTLKELSRYIATSRDEHRLVKLLFVCTHNSRRSHMAQIWAHTFAIWFQIPDVYCYSGGTEATAFHPNAIAAMQRCGFSIETHPSRTNPRQLVMNGNNPHEMFCYSKKYDEPPNPESNFAAVMVCSDADANCPVIPGAEKRISLPYDDPKNYDSTEQQTEMYDYAGSLIAKELYWCFENASEMMSR